MLTAVSFSITFAKTNSMRKLTSTSYSAASFNFALLILRVGMAVLLCAHGYDKLVHFMAYKKDFMNFMGLGNTATLALVVFSEFFCSILVAIGLFTRVAVIPILIGLFVALIKAHNAQVFGDGEHATLFIVGFIAVLLVGPGRISVDGMITK